MPVTAATAAEIAALRSGAALVDRSDRGRLALSGAEAREALSAVVTNEIEALTPGHGCLAACCTAKGRMLGDLRVLATETELLLDLERCALQPIFDVIRRGLVGYEAELHKRTLETSLFSLLGPQSRAVAGADSLGESEDDSVTAELGGNAVRLIATNVGVDVLCAAGDGAEVRGALIAAGATEAGEPLAELARIESGRPRFGIDLDETVIPEEGGLNARAVSFTKGCYVGQETIARLHYRGRPNRRLCSLKLSGEAELGSALSNDAREVGTLTSIALSPEDGLIGLALIRREAEDGATLRVGNGPVEAELFNARSEH